MIRSVAIVGAGIGAQHLAGFAALPERFRVVALCDLNTDRATEAVGDIADIRITADLTTILADPEIDIVDVCLPPHLHFPTCMAALDAGKTVVCEKPLVGSMSEIERLEAKIAETGGLVAPVFQYRFGIGAAQLRALIDAGLAGSCYAATLETHWDRPSTYYDIEWRGTWAGEQGGAVLGHAIHIHDLLCSFLGPVSKVYADLATRVNNIEVEDCAAISMQMESGAVVTSSVTLGCAGNMSRLRIMYEGFTVESDHSPYAPCVNPWHFTARAPTAQSEIDAVLENVTPTLNGYQGMFAALADRLDGLGSDDVSFEDGKRSIELVTAIYASARSGRPQNLPIDSQHPLYDGWVPNN